MMRLYKNKIWRYVHIFLGIAAVLAAFYLTIFSSNIVKAEGYSWVDGDIKVSRNTLRQPDRKSCVDKDLIIDGVNTEPRKYCYYDHGDWGYTHFDYNDESGYAFLVGDGNVAYYLAEGIPNDAGGLFFGGTVKVFNTNSIKDSIAIAVSQRLGSRLHSNLSVKVYNNIPSRLHLDEDVHNGTPRSVYKLDTTDTDYYGVEIEFFTTKPVLVSVQSLDASRNGRWLAFGYSVEGADGTSVMLIDMEGSRQGFVKHLDGSGYNDLAVSDDGKRVAVASPVGIDFFEMNDECNHGGECSFSSRRFSLLPQSELINLNFINNDRGLILSDKASGENIELRLFGENAGIEYLAIGDSYSSGEGDLGAPELGASYYINGTANDGQCHLSSRSYPFLLRDYYHIPNDDMKSVACSGAKLQDDYMSLVSAYNGQHNQLKGKTQSESEREREQALKSFNPGVVPQLEFVKKYQPEIITITGGGNDADFGGTLYYCVRVKDVIEGPMTCPQAVEGSEAFNALFDQINMQYTNMTSFVSKIKSVSPETKIVLVGYPSFVSEEDKCNLEVGSLNKQERIMINKAVSRLNEVLRAVAHDSRVSFIDVQDSLHGGRLCEKQNYVTGLTDEGYWDVLINHKYNQLFHPNATGHQKIFEKVKESGVFEGKKLVPSKSSYIPTDDYILTYSIPHGSYQRNKQYAVSIASYSLGPNTTVTTTAYSDPIDLGEHRVNDDGGLNFNIEPDKLPPGEHMIIIEGVDYEGNPVRYYQFVTVYDEDDSNEIDSRQKESSSSKKTVDGDESSADSTSMDIKGKGGFIENDSNNDPGINNEKTKPSQENASAGENKINNGNYNSDIGARSSNMFVKYAIVIPGSVLFIAILIYAIKRTRAHNG